MYQNAAQTRCVELLQCTFVGSEGKRQQVKAKRQSAKSATGKKRSHRSMSQEAIKIGFDFCRELDLLTLKIYGISFKK